MLTLNQEQNALNNDSWIEAMNVEIEQIENNKTWSLVPRPKDKNIIGIKWVFRNKLNEDGKVYKKKQDWFVKATPMKKVLTMVKPLPLLLD